jgi:transposase
MKGVELYGRVRRAVFVEGMSRREAGRVFGIDRRTVEKMLRFSIPPGYRRKKPVRRPKLDPFVEVIDQILTEDSGRPKKQRHTSKRIFERLRDERGYTGGITIVKDYVHAARQRQREMFVPLAHPPGHAQVDFGEALGVIGGIERKIHFLAMDLPHSDGCFVKAYPAETSEAFCDGHVSAFAFFGGVPLSKLVMSRENPRKTKPNTADDLLVASIRSRGLLQNLGVRPSDTSAGKYEVRYGGRRLAALRLLTKEGHFTKTQEFPCRIVPSDDADASEEALAENIVREALSPIENAGAKLRH